jgi:hypothetical protein
MTCVVALTTSGDARGSWAKPLKWALFLQNEEFDTFTPLSHVKKGIFSFIDPV